jgi:hypothetical protein
MGRNKLSRFFSTLTRSSSPAGVFNPWIDVDPENDKGPSSPSIRRKHLWHFLESRLKTARYLIIGEAVGYQGGHFSGIPMTSQRILLGFQREKGIYPEDILPGLKPQRTSKSDKMPRGFSEPTATIVWGTILNAGLKPDGFAVWNAFPWHPYDTKKGMLSNRKPKAKEMAGSVSILGQYVLLFSDTTVIAMGKVAEEWLRRLKIRCHTVRHPAQGGAKAFRRQLLNLLGRE